MSTIPSFTIKTTFFCTQVDHWITFASSLQGNDRDTPKLEQLEKALTMATYLVGQSLSAADLAIWGALFGRI